MENVSFGIAFLAGVISFLSPCVLPLVPGYISFLSGSSLDDLKDGKKGVMRSAGLTSVFFVLGFSVIFIALGASATFIGKVLADNLDILMKVAGGLIVLLGIHLTGILNIKWFNYQKKIQVTRKVPGPVTAFVVGLAFGFGWTPCVGPILAAILAMAATRETLLSGVVMLTGYSLGLGIPFIITGFAVAGFMKFFEKYRKFLRATEVVAGIFLIAVGVLIFTDNLGSLIQYLPGSFFSLAK